MTDDDDLEAALVALGALTSNESVLAGECEQLDPSFERAVAEWEEALAPLTAALAPVKPRVELFDAIEQSIRTRPQTTTLRASDDGWVSVSPGLRIKTLHKMPRFGRRTILLDVAPGAIYPEHDHVEDEEIFVVAGDLRIGDLQLSAGDFHASPAGSHHERATTQTGCQCLITMAA